MKTRLLKKIRSDKRFTLEHRGHVPGYYYSGWWYVSDLKLNRNVRHKKIQNVLNWLVNIYRWQFWLKFSAFTLVSIIIILLTISCEPERKEIWNPISKQIIDTNQLKDTTGLYNDLMIKFYLDSL